MKAVIGGVIFLVLVGAGIFYYDHAMSDPARTIGIACAKVNADKEVEIQVMITHMLVEESPPFDAQGNPDWDAWNVKHVQITDPSGKALKLSIARRSEVVPDYQAGSLEHYVLAYLKPGTEYVCTYIPKAAEPKKYVYKLTAAAEGRKYGLVDFNPEGCMAPT